MKCGKSLWRFHRRSLPEQARTCSDLNLLAAIQSAIRVIRDQILAQAKAQDEVWKITMAFSSTITTGTGANLFRSEPPGRDSECDPCDPRPDLGPGQGPG